MERPGQKEKIDLKRFGVLKPVGDVASKRLVLFESMLKTLIYEVGPTIIVAEDLNHGRNMDVVKVLAAFLGTAKKLAYEYSKAEPVMLSRTTILRTVMGKGNAEKEDVVAYVNGQLLSTPLPKDKSSEDMADAIVAGYCHILNLKSGDNNGQ